MTVTIIIGNTDDKLGQNEWAEFIKECDRIIQARAVRVWYHGFSAGDAPWQNTAWVIGFASDNPDAKDVLQVRLRALREHFGQDSIAWIEGETTHI